MINGKIIPSSTASEASFNSLANWLKKCVSSHSMCNPGEATRLPHRLLQLEGLPTPKIRLVETVGQTGLYACLSHCWGITQPIRLMKTNIQSFKTQIPWNSLPQMFKDVILLTIRLGISFLWIDSLCIIQDDEKDWQREAASMSAIYQNSHLTIAATNSRGNEESLFSATPLVYQCIQLDQISGQPLFLRKVLPHPRGYTTNETECPLLSRGWVYQECLLSPRLIHFTSTELVWECLEGSYCECEALNLMAGKMLTKVKHQSLMSNPQNLNSIIKRWHEILWEYSGLGLTFQADRLPAISGVAKQMHSAFGPLLGDYLAGTWEKTLHHDLMWCVSEFVKPRPFPRTAPSWSWASREGLVSFYKPGYEIKILGSKIIPQGPDNFGQLRLAELTLSGFLVPAILRLNRMGSGMGSGFRDHDLEIAEGRQQPVDMDYKIDEPGPSCIEDGSTVFCLRTGSSRESLKGGQILHADACLVLRPVEGKLATYERIGFIQAEQKIVKKWFSSCKEETVFTLI
jgi:hypothetical protein